MHTELLKTWEQARNKLKSQMTELSFRTWILPVHPVRIDDSGNMFLHAPAKEIKRTLNDYYYRAIEKAVKGVDSRIKGIAIISAEEAVVDGTDDVGLFFFVDGIFLYSGCALNEAEAYGDFLNYPSGHDAVWRKNYRNEYGVDYDHYPRGRIVYRTTDETYLLYFDKCIGSDIGKIAVRYMGKRIELHHDEHYRCHACLEND